MQKLIKVVLYRNTFNARSLLNQQRRNLTQFSEDQRYGKDGHYDVLIVGGGAAGLSLAGAICKNSILIQLFHFILSTLKQKLRIFSQK